MSNAALPVTPGAGLWVDVGGPGAGFNIACGLLAGGLFDGGGSGFCSGGGGGSSALLTAPRASATLSGDGGSDSRLLVAGGGGGAGQVAGDGGSAGNAAAIGAGAGGCAAIGGAGGVGPADGSDGGGGGSTCIANPSCHGGNGIAAVGGTGPSMCTGGGGGGGGWFGGGGGGAAGGGGGGSSYGGAGPSGGISIATASSSDAPAVVVSYTVSAPTASITTPVNGATYARGQVVNSSFSCAEGTGGPGIMSCLDQEGNPSGRAIDTSTPGQHTFRVTATSSDGLAGQSSVTYTVSPTTGPASTPTLRLRIARLSVFGPGAAARCRLTTGHIDRCEVRLRVGSHVLARGTRSAVAGADTLRVRLRLTAYGKRLLHRRLGGRPAKAVATDGKRTAAVRTRAILAVEHITTPPDSFMPNQAELTQSGRRFLRRLRDRLIAVSSYRCEGHTAAPETTAARSEHALAISLARAKLVCGALRRLGASGTGRPLARGGTRPIAPNATAAGRAKNRRVEILLRH